MLYLWDVNIDKLIRCAAIFHKFEGKYHFLNMTLGTMHYTACRVQVEQMINTSGAQETLSTKSIFVQKVLILGIPRTLRKVVLSLKRIAVLYLQSFSGTYLIFTNKVK